jgi:hypothetical protein
LEELLNIFFLAKRYFSIDSSVLEAYISAPTALYFEQIIAQFEVKEKDLAAFQDFLHAQTSESLVFNEWIEQHKGLKQLFTCQTSEVFFQDDFHWHTHAFYHCFQEYVFPFFITLNARSAEFEFSEEWAIIFSYTKLLLEEQKFEWELHFLNQIKSKLSELHLYLQSSTTEVELEERMAKTLNPFLFGILSALSRQSSSVKIQFIEDCLKLLDHPQGSPKLIYWLVKELEQMPLQESQKSGLEQAKKRIKEGKIVNQVVRNKATPIKNYWVVLPFIGLIFIVLWLMKQNTNVAPKLIFEGNALTFLLPEERRKVDSLIRTVDTIPFTKSAMGSGYYSTVYLRQPFLNQKVETLYQDLYALMQAHYTGKLDSLTVNKNLNASSLTSFKSGIKKGNNQFEVKNASAYDLFIILWSEKKNGLVVVEPLLSGKVKKFSYSADDQILFIPGIEMGTLKVPKNNWKAHFQQIDFNYEQFLLQPFQLQTLNKEGRLLFEGGKGDVLHVSDANGLLSGI